MTKEQYDEATGIVKYLDRLDVELEKIDRVTAMKSPYGYLKIKDNIGEISISLDVGMMKRCINLVRDVYYDIYQRKHEELERL